MKNNLVIKIFVLFSIIVLLASCRSGRPDMAKDMEGKGAVQDIEIFNVKKSAENFKETKNEFKDDVEEIRDLENIVKSDTRRVSLSPNKNENKTSLSIVDHNKFVKKLETQDISLKFNEMDIKSELSSTVITRSFISRIAYTADPQFKFSKSTVTLPVTSSPIMIFL